jgi:hypothetical protein
MSGWWLGLVLALDAGTALGVGAAVGFRLGRKGRA